ncbi:MAG: cobyrinate a,c-diamide synthase, partial [Spirulinaceae cyanobacterium]
MALIIAGERSGVGKTTITLALLAFLAQKSNKVQSFKVGPDYIDPMFHSRVTGLPCRNLDPLLTSEAYVSKCFAYHCQDKDYALVEGVMGLFDGVKFKSLADFASTAHIARLLELPVVLVIDCSRLSGSVAAIAHGYSSFDAKVKLAGVILNKVGSDRHLELLQEALESLNLPILGILRRQDDIAIPDRHLGLVPTGELPQFKKIITPLTNLAAKCFNWDKLLPLLTPKKTSFPVSNSLSPRVDKKVKIALAWDRAFNFYYQDNLDILEQLGAELIPWSPLRDINLPQGIKGCYLGGGFPEVFAQELTGNEQILKQLKASIEKGLPIYAECGGLMYLGQQIVDFAGKYWPMVGVLPTGVAMG